MSAVVAGTLAAIAVIVAGHGTRRRPGRVPTGIAALSAVDTTGSTIDGRGRLPSQRSTGGDLRAVRQRPASRSASPPAAELARWCSDLSSATRTGSSLASAFDTVDPPGHLADGIDRARVALRRGASLDDAVSRLAATCADDRVAIAVVRACARTSSPPGEPLDRAAAALRQRHAEWAERRAQSAPARLSAIVMTALPVAMLVVLLATSGDVRAVMATWPGLATVALGGLANLTGWRWSRRLIRRAAR